MSPETALLEHLDPFRAELSVLVHTACRTSAESRAARGAAGVPNATGAKALVVSQGEIFSMFVLPGERRLDSKRTRGLIGKYRFATPDEVAAATDGLEIGTIPPFGRPVFPRISRLIVDRGIPDNPLIGFNAGSLVRSIVMPGRIYLAAAQPDIVTEISVDHSLTSEAGD